ncbi:MAG: Holliday junction branch migration DNA helicase RuvB [Armatimonadota bacterium]
MALPEDADAELENGRNVELQPERTQEDEQLARSVRPERFADFVNQSQVVEILRVAIEAAKGRGEPVDHILLYGPPGLGKTTLARIVAKEMGASITMMSGPTLRKPGDLMGTLTNLAAGDVIFIDEVHRLPQTVEEFIYPAMEDFVVDFVLEQGIHAAPLRYQLRPFALIGATTRAGLLSAPLRERFGIFAHVDFYEPEDLVKIVRRSAALLGITIDDGGTERIAYRARGTPRIANRLLRRVRDHAAVKGDGRVTDQVADDALAALGVDEKGLDVLDRKYLRTIIDYYHGGPVGIAALAATLNEEADTLTDVVEPFLLKIGFVTRTPQGRCATERAYAHIGASPPPSHQPRLPIS